MATHPCRAPRAPARADADGRRFVPITRDTVLDLSVYLRFVLALAGVLALIAFAAFALKRFGFGGLIAPKGAQKRLAVSAALALDGRRRLLIVRRDDTEHLLLVGGPNDLVIEAGIAPGSSGGAPSAPVPSGERS